MTDKLTLEYQSRITKAVDDRCILWLEKLIWMTEDADHHSLKMIVDLFEQAHIDEGETIDAIAEMLSTNTPEQFQYWMSDMLNHYDNLVQFARNNGISSVHCAVYHICGLSVYGDDIVLEQERALLLTSFALERLQQRGPLSMDPFWHISYKPLVKLLMERPEVADELCKLAVEGTFRRMAELEAYVDGSGRRTTLIDGAL